MLWLMDSTPLSPYDTSLQVCFEWLFCSVVFQERGCLWVPKEILTRFQEGNPLKEITNSFPKKFMLHHLSIKRFLLWALLTSCYHSITCSTSEQLCWKWRQNSSAFSLWSDVRVLNASFQTECVPPGKSPRTSCQYLARQPLRKKCSAPLKSFSANVSGE